MRARLACRARARAKIRAMRIVSLLPSLTEIVFAIGAGSELVGVSHECDYPGEARALPKLTRSRIGPSASSLEIDRLVSEERASLYELDAALLADLAPDIILTQAQCDVCAVNEAQCRSIASSIPGSPLVESFAPIDLESVCSMIERVGEVIGKPESGRKLVEGFRNGLNTIAKARSVRERATIVHLEWIDPPFCSGHWNPEILKFANLDEVIGKSGEPSERISWEAVVAADPKLLLVAPCGFEINRAKEEWDKVKDRPGIAGLPAVREGRVIFADGNAHFSRPGPRLADSARHVADAADDLFRVR